MSRVLILELPYELNGKEEKLYPVLIHSGAELILVDCGYPHQLPVLEKVLLEKGINPTAITLLILTHHDIDHMGTAAAWKRKYPHTAILAPAEETDYINGAEKSPRLIQAETSLDNLGDEQKIFAHQFIGFLNSLEPVEIDRLLTNGDYPDMLGNVEVVATPGHTPGHISLYIRDSGTMIAADAVVIENGHLNIANPHYSLNLQQAIQSVNRLRNYEITELICYHGGLFSGNVQDALNELIEEYQTIATTSGISEP